MSCVRLRKGQPLHCRSSKCVPSELKLYGYYVNPSAEILFVCIQPETIPTLKLEDESVPEKHALTNLRDYEMWT